MFGFKSRLPILIIILSIIVLTLAVNIPSIRSHSPATATATNGPVMPEAFPSPFPTDAKIEIPIKGTSILPTSRPSPTPTLIHVLIPKIPPYHTSYFYDTDSSKMAAQGHPKAGDKFEKNLYERPFNSKTQDIYFPEVDIIQTSISIGNPFTYASISLSGLDSNGQLNASYGIEIDINIDGRGDLLITASNPSAEAWTTDRVQIWRDEKQSVGGIHPIKPDAPQTGEGYNHLIFDQGRGIDPDLAWARISPSKPNEIWFAFKSSLLQGSQKFMWGAWAQRGGLHPEWFDYNDHYTQKQAGSPLPDLIKYYPLKELSEMDNTCRWAIGFTPLGEEPGICPADTTAP